MKNNGAVSVITPASSYRGNRTNRLWILRSKSRSSVCRNQHSGRRFRPVLKRHGSKVHSWITELSPRLL